jgi:hypothetical protein
LARIRVHALPTWDSDDCENTRIQDKKGIYEMETTSTLPVVVESGGDQVVAHVGLHALGDFADRLGLGESLSACIPIPAERAPVHDRGKVLVHTSLMLAGGGESCADIEHLRAQTDLFGHVASDSTVYRTFHEITPEVRAAIAGGFARVRHEVWRRTAVTKGNDPIYLDIDASLIEIHSENKQETGPNYQGGFGFHPLLCFADCTGEALAGMLRPGNAGANNASDHVLVVDEAVAQLPPAIAVGHLSGDDPSLVKRKVVIRADSAGCTEKFVAAARSRNIGFSVVCRSNAQVHSAIFDTLGFEELWHQAIRQDSENREGAAVIELTDLVTLPTWPTGTRLIVRREPLHPGVQHSLFPSLEYRYWGFYTDQDGDPVELDRIMRAHAHVEQNISRLKDSGLLSFPFTKIEANRNWMATVMMAADLVRWFQLLCLDGFWTKARPKALRWGFFHSPGRLVHTARQSIVRILDGWPSAGALIGAYEKMAALC